MTTRAIKLVRKDPKKALQMAEELFEDMEAHGYAVKCPKCRSVNVLLLIELRRGSTAMVS